MFSRSEKFVRLDPRYFLDFLSIRATFRTHRERFSVSQRSIAQIGCPDWGWYGHMAIFFFASEEKEKFQAVSKKLNFKMSRIEISLLLSVSDSKILFILVSPGFPDSWMSLHQAYQASCWPITVHSNRGNWNGVKFIGWGHRKGGSEIWLSGKPKLSQISILKIFT